MRRFGAQGARSCSRSRDADDGDLWSLILISRASLVKYSGVGLDGSGEEFPLCNRFVGCAPTPGRSAANFFVSCC
jgi:hypothetical protein